MCVSRFAMFAEALTCRALWDRLVLSFENDLMVVKDLQSNVRAGDIALLLATSLDVQILGDLQRKKRIMNLNRYRDIYIYINLINYIHIFFIYCKWDLGCSVVRPKSSTHLHPLHSARGTLHLTSNLRSEPKKSNTRCLIYNLRSQALSLETIKNHEIRIHCWHLLASF